MYRKDFLRNVITTGLFASAFPGYAKDILDAINHSDRYPSVRRITNGPKHHWFGYYDKMQIDSTNRYALGMQIDFEHRSPEKEDKIKIGVIDLQNGDSWTELGESRAWGWQQGCMLQWIPNTNGEIIWNDREGNRFVAHILNIHTGQRRKLDKPIYTLSPDGTWGVGLDFGRLQDLRPGYGYKAVPDPYKHMTAPEKTGIYRIDLRTGESKFIIPYSTCAKIPHKGEDVSEKWHWYNHLLISPDGERLVFLNRWRDSRDFADQGSGFVTRMFTADKNGGDLFTIDPSGYTSHFVWKDPKCICAWTRPDGYPDGFYELEDKSGGIKPVGKDVMVDNGHNTYIANKNNDWILNDTYPKGVNRLQTPYLYQVSKNQRIDLGAFHSGSEYKGEWRCDLHPRSSPDGKTVIIDSVHEGLGRQMYLIDISNIIS